MVVLASSYAQGLVVEGNAVGPSTLVVLPGAGGALTNDVIEIGVVRETVVEHAEGETAGEWLNGSKTVGSYIPSCVIAPA